MGFFCDHYYDLIFAVSILLSLYLMYKNTHFLYIAILVGLLFTLFGLKTTVLDSPYEPFLKVLPNYFSRNYIGGEEVTIIVIIALLTLKYKKNFVLKNLKYVTYFIVFVISLFFFYTQENLSKIDVENKKK